MLFALNWELDKHTCPVALLAKWKHWYCLFLCIFSSSHCWYWMFRFQVVQQPSGAIVKQVSTLPQPSVLTLQTSAEKKMPLNTLVQTNQFPAGKVKCRTLFHGQGGALLRYRNKCRLLVDFRSVRRWLSVSSSQFCALSWTSLLSGALMRKSMSHLLLTLVKSTSIKYLYLLKYCDWTPCSELPLSWGFWELFHEALLFLQRVQIDAQ